MATCFDNFIGVRCVSQTTPKSGLYIDDLEGINIRRAADMADSGFSSGVQLLESKINFATQIILDEMARFAMPYFRMNSLVDEFTIGEWDNAWNAPAALDRGVRINTRDSRMLRIRIQSVKIKIQQPGYSGNVDIADGLKITSFAFTTNANGDAEIFPNYLSETDEIFVTMDNTAIDTNKTKVKGGCRCSTKKSEFLIANGWSGTTTTGTSFGLMVGAAAECSMDEIGCVIAQKLRFPILYRAGMEVAKEALTTDRLNSITLLDSDTWNFCLENWTAQYDAQMKTAIQQLPELLNRMDDICIICNQSRYVYGTP
jgi:hypothetical protein